MRAEELRVDELLQVPGPDQARGAARSCSQRRGMAWDDAAFVGDDLADLQVMRRVGLPIAVANAVPEIRAVADVRDRARRAATGPCGEVVEALLKARGAWPEMLERYFTEPGSRGLPDAGALVELGRRVLRLEAAAVGRRRRPAGRAVRRAVRAAGRRQRAGHRLRCRKIGAGRPKDRGDAHVDRHARQLPASDRLAARRPRHRRRATTSRSCSARAASRRTCSAWSARSSGLACRSSPSPASRTRRWRGWPRWCSTARWPRRPAPTIWRPRRAPPPRSRWATRWRWRCSSSRGFGGRISRRCTPAAASDGGCSSGCAT